MVKMLLVCVRYHFTPGSTGREEVRMELVCLVAGGRARKQTNQGLVNSGFGAGRLGKRYICPRCLPPQPLQHHNPVFMTSTSNFTTVNSSTTSFRMRTFARPGLARSASYQFKNVTVAMARNMSTEAVAVSPSPSRLPHADI